MIDKPLVPVGGLLMHTHSLRGKLRVLTMPNKQRAASRLNNVASKLS